MTNPQPKSNNDHHCNSQQVAHAVGMALLRSDKLPPEQRADLIDAALTAFKIILVDDLTHLIGAGRVDSKTVVDRILELGIGTEDRRRGALNRFINLCDLLKPEVNISVEFREGGAS